MMSNLYEGWRNYIQEKYHNLKFTFGFRTCPICNTYQQYSMHTIEGKKVYNCQHCMAVRERRNNEETR